MELFSSTNCFVELTNNATLWLKSMIRFDEEKGEQQYSSLIEDFSGVKVNVSKIGSAGCISINASLEAICFLKEAWTNLIHKQQNCEKEVKMANKICMENQAVVAEPSTFIADFEEVIHFEDNNNDGEDDGSYSCLNIEVLHSSLHKEKDNAIVKKSYSCTLCSFSSQRVSHFNKHMALHSSGRQIYRCDHCNFSSLRLTHLRRHEATHSDKMLKCPSRSCNYTTDESKLLERHKRLKHQPALSAEDQHQTSIRQCPACPYFTSRKYLYERHLRVHSTDGNSIQNFFICDKCDYRTQRKIHYMRHLRDVHSVQCRAYLCDHCGKSFKRPDALKQHSIQHASKEAYTSTTAHKCKLCFKLCHSRAHLREHLAVHSTDRTFLCEICGASFKTLSVQRKHVASLHLNPRSFSCERCSKRFNTKYALRRHMKQHPAIPSEAEKRFAVEEPLSDDTTTKSIKFSNQSEESLPFSIDFVES